MQYLYNRLLLSHLLNASREIGLVVVADFLNSMDKDAPHI